MIVITMTSFHMLHIIIIMNIIKKNTNYRKPRGDNRYKHAMNIDGS